MLNLFCRSARNWFLKSGIINDKVVTSNADETLQIWKVGFDVKRCSKINQMLTNLYTVKITVMTVKYITLFLRSRILN